MVVAHSKSDASLILSCHDEPLSDSQLAAQKKKVEDLALLQSALQFATFKADGLTNGSGEAIQNPSDLLNLVLSRGKDAARDELLKQHGYTSKKAGRPRVSVRNVAEIAEPPPSLTQTLRATRKSTGHLPPPRIQESPDIEVVAEKKIKVKPVTAQPNLAAYKPIMPRNYGGRTPVTHSTIKLKPTTCNTILLTISIKPRNVASVTVNAAKRKELDAKVKTILIKSPAEFVEFLFNQGLIRSQQYCSVHKNVNMQPNKLKLGMFNDAQVLPNSGGYVWIGECCGRKYVSVYAGAIFGTTPADKVPTATIAKLIYHWSCQTAIPNVENWVKVDKSYIGRVYQYFRAICSVVLHDKVFDFGMGENKVELGIVSLGTTTPDGNRKSVKVEILGLYDRKSGHFRLFASAPESTNNARERFMRILKPIAGVVAKTAVVVCDQSVDPTCLQQLGYSKIDICSSREDENSPSSNGTIMAYLRRHVPKMFQVALSNLSESQVQMCLDELCWREKYGYTSLNCFENMMEHLSYLTMMEIDNPGLIPLVDYVSENPQKNWKYKVQSVPPQPAPTIKAQMLIPPADGNLSVLNSQPVDSKKLHPITHPNKVMSESAASSLSLSIGGRTGRMNSVISSLVASNMSPTSAKGSPRAASPHVAASTLSSGGIWSDYKLLEPYFYAKISGNSSLGQEPNICHYKCHLCADTYTDNVEFYSHLKYHLEGITANKSQVGLICPYCTSRFETVNAVNKHKIDVHLMSDLSQLWCRICAEKFTTEALLRTHMIRKHVEAELPYRCHVCSFATSFYYEAINHFDKVHRGTPYVQCHFCLSVKTITSISANTFSTRMFTHMSKHLKKMSCNSCVLTFYAKSLNTEHKRDHLSCVEVEGLTRYEAPTGYRVLQFKPTKTTTGAAGENPMVFNTKNQVAMSSTIKDFALLTLVMYLPDYDDMFICKECDQDMLSAEHFRRQRNCTKCNYATNCGNIIAKHSEIFHPPTSAGPVNYVVGPPIQLPNPMRCLCGFSTSSGNHLARHLILCGYSTAYSMEIKPMTSIEAKSEFLPQEMMFEDDAPPADMEDDDDDDDFVPMMPLDVQLDEN